MTKKERFFENLRTFGEFLLDNFKPIAFFVLVVYVGLCFLYPPVPIAPTLVTSDESFTGLLGMISYTHSFFNLGGVDSTTLTFQNGSDLVSFKFNKDIAVSVGNNYTVRYQFVEKNYYNLSEPVNKGFQWNFFAVLQNMAPFSYFENSTEIVPQDVFLSVGGQGT